MKDSRSCAQSPATGELLTPSEHAAVTMLGEFAGLMREIIGDEDQNYHDWTEAAQHIHVLQHMVMAQAASRAYPERYRRLGEVKGK